ncbi:Cas10/Cmr2 second palm domain-containing protein [Picosynechococcus sp. NKBG042902]|uniref:Cas10/Cmr2 second palm domain-containing protein n=1 Tax=Picosynechococcus sp. NKBG042902 TaxID=490193 RepID=UPI0004AAA229|nr:hypothetical protein [Picosynechococcus sp. NKBG042902]
MTYYLVLIETSGNQQFIFSTNKLRENIGASELTYRAGTQLILETVGTLTKTPSWQVWQDPERLRILLRDDKNRPIKDKNRPIEFQQDGKHQIEILTAASGKALLLTKTKDTAQAVIQAVTKKAILEAPGLDIMGVYEVIEDWETNPEALSKAIAQVHKTYEKVRAERATSPQSRFLRLPIMADCAVSELPASVFKPKPGNSDERERLSSVSDQKRETAPKAQERLQAIAKPHKLFQDLDKLEKQFEEDLSWIAIVHADGNGLGQIFLNFQKYISEPDNRTYANEFRRFSLALDDCTEAAFREALKVFEKDNKKNDFLPIVPLIVGGDDLTVICHGQYALEFTRVFLQEFEIQTAKHKDIRNIASKAFGVKKLSACAGIAVIKPHFPFSVAYHLAERLIKSAKTVKETVKCIPTKQIEENTPFPCSAIDFHILYDSSGADFDEIRDRLQPEENTLLHNRPYVVSHSLEGAKEPGKVWADRHDWSKLATRIQALKDGDLARSQGSNIRTALHIGQAAADAQYRLIKQRYNSLNSFKESENSLFHTDEANKYRTSFLDALDAMDFLKNDQDKNNTEDAE